MTHLLCASNTKYTLGEEPHPALSNAKWTDSGALIQQVIQLGEPCTAHCGEEFAIQSVNLVTALQSC
jgi:hypothetical protein